MSSEMVYWQKFTKEIFKKFTQEILKKVTKEIFKQFTKEIWKKFTKEILKKFTKEILISMSFPEDFNVFLNLQTHHYNHVMFWKL